MAIRFTVRVRRVGVPGRSLMRRTAALAGGAACIGLTAALWVPSVQADTTGTGSWTPTPATRSITVSTNGLLSGCIHPDLQSANGLAMPGRCEGHVTVSNTGDEAVIRAALAGWTPSPEGVSPCDDRVFFGVLCTGPTSSLSAYSVGLAGRLPGTNQFAVRVTGPSDETLAVNTNSVPTPVCDVAFGGLGGTYGGCRAATLGAQSNEVLLLFGPSDGTPITGFSVEWEADPLQ